MRANGIADLLAIAQGLYAANRFIATGLMMMKAFKPRYMLTVYLGLCVVFAIAAMNTTGAASVALCILVFCFESVCPLDNVGDKADNIVLFRNDLLPRPARSG